MDKDKGPEKIDLTPGPQAIESIVRYAQGLAKTGQRRQAVNILRGGWTLTAEAANELVDAKITLEEALRRP